MHEDLLRDTNQAKQIAAAWEKNVELFSSKPSELQEIVNLGLHSYEFVYAARYFKLRLSEYQKVPSKYFEPFSGEFDSSKALHSRLDEIEKSALRVWLKVAPQIEKELPRAEWKKFLAHLDATSGSSKYATDLGRI
jgi:hypothetical protein